MHMKWVVTWILKMFCRNLLFDPICNLIVRCGFDIYSTVYKVIVIFIFVLNYEELFNEKRNIIMSVVLEAL